MSNVAPLNISSAVVVLDSSLDGWTFLDSSEKTERTFLSRVTFGREFTAPPVVHVGIVGLDVSKDDNVRLRVRAIPSFPS